jgi:hypothetical protein
MYVTAISGNGSAQIAARMYAYDVWASTHADVFHHRRKMEIMAPFLRPEEVSAATPEATRAL